MFRMYCFHFSSAMQSCQNVIIIKWKCRLRCQQHLTSIRIYIEVFWTVKGRGTWCKIGYGGAAEI